MAVEELKCDNTGRVGKGSSAGRVLVTESVLPLMMTITITTTTILQYLIQMISPK
jgi:hypothetical protein